MFTKFDTRVPGHTLKLVEAKLSSEAFLIVEILSLSAIHFYFLNKIWTSELQHN